jgi:hypothetical protein
MKRFLAVAVLTIPILALLGCGDGGPPLGAVSGIVTLDGKPQPNVAVTFIPAEGGSPASGKTDASGKYELFCLDKKGAPLGKHKVAITTVQQSAAPAAVEISSDSPEYANQGSSSDYNVKFTEPIPAKYNQQTELTAEVKSGSNEVNFDLKSS